MPLLLDGRRCGACKMKSAERGTSLFAPGYSATVMRRVCRQMAEFPLLFRHSTCSQ
jgi:hypothetical protein